MYFLNYLAFLRSAADRSDSLLPWVVSRGRLYGFLWYDTSKKGLFKHGLFASKHLMHLHESCCSPLDAKCAKHWYPSTAQRLRPKALDYAYDRPFSALSMNYNFPGKIMVASSELVDVLSLFSYVQLAV
jgi:hypothetical protein